MAVHEREELYSSVFLELLLEVIISHAVPNITQVLDHNVLHKRVVHVSCKH